MRETRTCGSEGGEALRVPTSIVQSVCSPGASARAEVTRARGPALLPTWGTPLAIGGPF